MKNALFTVVLMLGLALSAAQAEAAAKVFLLGGQSNMAGVGGYPGGMINGETIPPEPAMPAPYNVAQPDVQFWYNNAWTDLRPGFGYQSTEFGPEVTFGYRLNELFPDDDIYLVKYAVSGANLAVDWNPGGGTCYNTFKSTVNAALQNLSNNGRDPVVAGMIWMQGESDAHNSTYAPLYGTNLASLINTVRSDFSAPEMQFVVGRITNVYAWGTEADMALVRTAQEAVPGIVGDASWINTDDLQVVYTGHYGTEGQVNLGIRFANEFIVPEPSSLTLLAVLFLSMAFMGSLIRILHKRKRQGPIGCI
ncbi:MAG: hypothetical protein JW959_05985 [Pirellulales bacterium]|nr:hypothetical protein [Pirellulales bacterium]